MTGYVRVDTSNNISDGNVIAAADLDNEFDGVQAGFNASTGHTHGGSAGEGAPITKLGPTQDVTASASLLAPKTTNTVDVGSSLLKFKDLWLAGNASVAGTLGVTGVATLTAQPVLSSLTASQAVFTDASKGLVSNAITGTGSVVMSASPTLTGTVNVAGLTASNSVTLSGGTANGVTYLNGSKVLTSGSALTFDGTTFGVQLSGRSVNFGTTTAANFYTAYRYNSGDIGYIGNGPSIITAGSSATDFAIGTASTNPLLFAINSTEGMRLTSTGLTINSLTANGVVYANGSKTLTSGSTLTFDGSTLLNSGMVRSTTLSVVNSTSPVNQFANLNVDSTGLDINSSYVTSGSGTIRFSLVSSEQMRLTSTGLGIGTSSPTTKLDVSGNAVLSGASGYKYLYFNGSTENSSSRFAKIGKNYDSTFEFGIWASTAVAGNPSATVFYRDQTTESMRLDSSGNLGLGVTPSANSLSGSGYRGFELSTTKGSGLLAGGGDMFVLNNTYFDGGFKYANTGAASRYVQSGGQNIWYNAPSGTAGNAISFTQAMTLDASGNLGVGTTSPTAKLNVVGGNIRLDNNQGLEWGGGNNFIYGNETSDFIVIATNGSERARIDASGNLGLGVTPSAWGSGYAAFQLPNGGAFWAQKTGAPTVITSANAVFTGSAYNYLGSYAATLALQSGGQHQWYTAPSGTAGAAITFTQALTLDASGNLGLGTTSVISGARMDIRGNNSNTLTDLSTQVLTVIDDTSYAQNVGGGIGFGYKYSSTNQIVQRGAVIKAAKENATDGNYATALVFATAPNAANTTEKMRLDSSGNLLVGRTSGGLNNSSGSTFSPTIAMQSEANSVLIYLNRTSSDGTIQEFRRNNVSVGTISVTTSATAYNTSSDYRLKNITGPITTSGAYIDSLNPVEGTWKADGSTFVGLIAHEAQEASRTQVATGTKDGEEMQGMSYSSSEMIANMIAELKALRARVAALEAA